MQEYIDFINNYKSGCSEKIVEIKQGRYKAILIDTGFVITVDTGLTGVGIVALFKYTKNKEPIFLTEPEKIEAILKGMHDKIAAKVSEYSRIQRKHRDDFEGVHAYVRYLENHLDFLLIPTGSNSESGVFDNLSLNAFLEHQMEGDHYIPAADEPSMFGNPNYWEEWRASQPDFKGIPFGKARELKDHLVSLLTREPTRSIEHRETYLTHGYAVGCGYPALGSVLAVMYSYKTNFEEAHRTIVGRIKTNLS